MRGDGNARGGAEQVVGLATHQVKNQRTRPARRYLRGAGEEAQRLPNVVLDPATTILHIGGKKEDVWQR